MNVEIQIDNRVFPVGCKALEQYIDAVNDIADNKELFDLLAKHPSENVRCAIAQKLNIGQETFDELALTGGYRVLKNLLSRWGASSGSCYLKDNYVQQLLDSKDSGILELLINELDIQDICKSSERVDLFLKHENPDIRLALADDCASKSIMRRLLNDKDPDVRNAAKESLAPYR